MFFPPLYPLHAAPGVRLWLPKNICLLLCALSLVGEGEWPGRTSLRPREIANIDELYRVNNSRGKNACMVQKRKVLTICLQVSVALHTEMGDATTQDASARTMTDRLKMVRIVMAVCSDDSELFVLGLYKRGKM